MNEIFQNRFVVFIDILGFGAMVSDASKKPDGEVAKRIDQALSTVQNMSLLEADAIDTEPSIAGFRSHIFSDCIVMSVEPDSLAVSKLFVELAKLTVDLMSIGVWVRGGMSFGLISKRQSTPWGPAVVEAYKIESTLALNPRIALSKSAFKFVTEEMDNKQKDKLIVRDTDGVWSLAPINWALHSKAMGKEYMTKAVAKKVQFHLEKEISETVDNPSVFRKIAWLALQWNEQMQPLNGYPSFDCRTSYRENPIHLETVNW